MREYRSKLRTYTLEELIKERYFLLSNIEYLEHTNLYKKKEKREEYTENLKRLSECTIKLEERVSKL